MRKPETLARVIASFFACNSLGVATQAYAQESTPEGTILEEIIVTALHLETSLTKTPVAVTSVDGDALRSAGVLDPTRLDEEVPNLSIIRGNGLQITIRGVTSADATEKGDPSAAFLLDGVYLARPQVQDVAFFDIERVEVLRGPQGTLYGRNTTAGVVNVISNKPAHEFQSAVNASFGDFGTQRVDAMVNAPLGDVWALRAAAVYDKRDSYNIPLSTDQVSLDPFKENTTVRVQTLADFNDDVSLLLKVDYSDLQGTPSGGNVRASNFYDPAELAVPPPPVGIGLDPIYQTGDGDSESRRTLNYTQLGEASLNNNTWGVSAELNWDLGPLALTYLGSYREFENEQEGNLPVANGVPAIGSLAFGDYSQNSQELRFATTSDGPFKGQFGVYWFKEESDIAFYILDFIPGVPFFGFPQDPTIAESYAVFGQGTYDITDALHLTLGARYSHDDKSRVGATVFQQELEFNPATDFGSVNAAQTTSEKTTWRVGLDYDIGDTSMFYGVISTGYKAGGFNDGCEAGTTVNGVACDLASARDPELLYYDPETLTSYELGYKTRAAEGRVQVSVAAFHYDYENLQLSTVLTIAGAPQQATTNAAEASVNGLEFEGSFAPSERHRFDLWLAYLDAQYEDYFPRGEGTAPDYKGRSLDRAPEFTATGGYTYSYPLSNGGHLSGNIRTRWSDDYMVTVFATPRQFNQSSYTRTDVGVTYTAADDKWYVQAFGENLEDEILVIGADTLGNVTPSEPSTYGVRVGVKF